MGDVCALLDAVEAALRDSDMQQLASSLNRLADVAADGDRYPHLMAHGAMPVLCRVLRASAQLDSDCAEAACRAACRLLREGHVAASHAGVDAGLPAGLTRALAAHGTASVQLCEAACAALCYSLRAAPAGTAACVAADTPTHIVAALARHAAASTRVAEAGATFLCNIAAAAGSETGGAAACVAAGAADALVYVLNERGCTRNDDDSARVAEAACGALRNMARVGGEAGLRACVGAGAPSAVVLALRALLADAPSGGGVQAGQVNDSVRAACNALQRLCGADVGRVACLAAGAVPLLAGILRTHAAWEPIANHATVALRLLACVPDGKTACVEARVPQLVIATMTTHAAVADYVAEGVAALRNLSGSVGRDVCLAAGAPEALTAALRAHGAAEGEMVEDAGVALRLLSAAPEGRAACLAAGALRELVAAARPHLSAVRVTEAALAGVRRMSGGSGCAAAAWQAGAHSLALDAMEAQPGSEEIAEFGCFVLSAVGGDVPVAEEELGARGAHAVVTAALRAHAGSAAVAREACAALGNLCGESPGIERAVAAGAPDAVTSALRRHGADDDVAEWAMQALRNLTYTTSGADACIAAGAPAAVMEAMRTHAGTPSSETASEGLVVLRHMVAAHDGGIAVADAGAFLAMQDVLEPDAPGFTIPPDRLRRAAQLAGVLGRAVARAQLSRLLSELLADAVRAHRRRGADGDDDEWQEAVAAVHSALYDLGMSPSFSDTEDEGEGTGTESEGEY